MMVARSALIHEHCDMSDAEQIWEETLRRAMDVLNEFDPAGLVPGEPDGVPEDEYRFEAHELMNGLLESGELTSEEVRSLFDRMFWPGLIDETGSRALAARLTEIHLKLHPRS